MVDDSQNVYVTGQDSANFGTIKYNTLGIQQWVAIYNSPSNEDDGAASIGLDSEGNIYVAGYSIGAMHYSDSATVKYNSSGIEQWVKRYEGSANFEDRLQAMAVDKTGNVFVTGYSTETGTGYDYTTIKYNTNGEQKWVSRYNYGLNDIALAMAIDKSDNVYVTGESYGNGTGADYATVKFDSSGIQKWAIRYTSNGDTDDVAEAIGVDSSGNVFVTGYSGKDIITIKYSQIISGINPTSLDIPNNFKLEQNYPNPFNPKTIINYQLSMPNLVQLKVYDVLGNEVATLVNKKQNAGSYQVEFDGSNLPSGIYLYSLEADGNVLDTKRMILLR